jgi:hypothetical protein
MKKSVFFLSITTIYLFLGLHKGRPSYIRSPSISKHEISYFFLLFGVTFALLDPDPDSEYGSGSADLIESGSNPDPDPKP